jgi:hypothetical protein
MKIWKQLLRPDIWYKTARGWFCPTNADCRQYVEGTKRALANKVPIPVPLEHHREADPSRLPLSREQVMANLVGLNVGFLDDLRINPDGSIDAQLDVDWVPDGNGQPIRDEAEIKARLAKSIKFVSPYIVSDLTDGYGNSYGPGIAHAALTANPVDHGQQPFALSKSVTLGRGLFLSLAHSRSMSMPTAPEAPAPATTPEAPKTGQEMLAAIKQLVEEQPDAAPAELWSAIRAHFDGCFDVEDEDGDEGPAIDHDESGAVPARPEPQYTALSRAAGRPDAGDLIASKFPRTTVAGLPRSKNSH